METHDQDPTAEDRTDPWNSVHDEIGDLGRRLRETYRRVASDGGPSEDEIKDAVGTLMGAWDQMAESVGTALRDPEVRRHLKAAVSSLASALGETIGELGSELRGPDGWGRARAGETEEE